MMMMDASLPHPPPRRPALIDTAALLPALRREAAVDAVEFLARAAAVNVLEAARWAASQPATARTAPFNPETPCGVAIDALASLFAASARYRACTGCDGLDLAHDTVAGGFGKPLADAILHVLLTIRESVSEIDALNLHADGPVEPPMTDAERADIRRAIMDYMFADARLDGLRAALDVFRLALGGSGGQPTPEGLGPVSAVRAAVRSALEKGAERTDLQVALDAWSTATGGPRITVTVDA